MNITCGQKIPVAVRITRNPADRPEIETVTVSWNRGFMFVLVAPPRDKSFQRCVANLKVRDLEVHHPNNFVLSGCSTSSIKSPLMTAGEVALKTARESILKSNTINEWTFDTWAFGTTAHKVSASTNRRYLSCNAGYDEMDKASTKKRKRIPMKAHDPVLADKIKDLRSSLGLLQAQFAQKLKVSPTQISEWEKGTKERPSVEKLLEMASIASDGDSREWFWRKAGVDLESIKSHFREKVQYHSCPTQDEPEGV